MPIKFRFRWIPFLATAFVAVAGISLGQWQARRATEKEAIEAMLSARESAPPVALDAAERAVDEMAFRRVRVKGEFVRGWPVYLDNRPHGGSPGFYLLMPLKIAGSDKYVLVMRGWVRRDVADRTKLPAIPTPAGVIEIEGVARRTPGRLLQLGTPEPVRPNAIVQNVDVAQIARSGSFRMQPFVIEQLTDTQDGLVRDWPRPSAGAEKHRGYAFQWYALAVTALAFFVVTGFRRGRKT